jgi:hypothetical protein
MRSWAVFEEECRKKGGELSPVPCSYYNSYCDEHEGRECVYYNEPIFEEDDVEGLPAYCCSPVKR